MEHKLHRDTYRSIKRMTHKELEDFLERYCNHMIENIGEMLDLSAMEQDISQISGIGEKRLEEIMGVIKKYLNVKSNTDKI